MYKRIYKNICYIALLVFVITTVVVMITMYTAKSMDFKKSVREKAYLAAALYNDGEAKNLEKISDEDFRISIIASDGSLIFDSTGALGERSDRPEVKDAIRFGSGEATRRSETLNERVYYYAVSLTDGSILRASSSFSGFWADFLVTAIPVLFIVLLVYILSIAFAGREAEIIGKTMRDALDGELDETSAQYSEIMELADKIKDQNSQIQGQRQKLSSQKSQLKLISKNMHEGLAVLEADGSIALINDRCAQIFSERAEGLKYKNFFELNGAAGLYDKFIRVMKNGAEDVLYEIGGKMHEIFFSPVTDSAEVCIGAMLIIIDIDDKYEAETVRREFCANVSHELKTPLTTILGYSQIINSGVAKPEDILRFSEKIEKESTRLIAIVEDIIKLSSLDEQIEAENEKTDVKLLEVARDVAERLSSQAAKMKINIEVGGNDFSVRANPVQINEMMYNLADNAVKYNVAGGSVKIHVFEDGFFVSDTGIGIKKEYHERIFERFFRVDKSHSKKVNGTGLGLSIVKHIANVNNAAVTVSDSEEGGTKFTVKFK